MVPAARLLSAALAAGLVLLSVIVLRNPSFGAAELRNHSDVFHLIGIWLLTASLLALSASHRPRVPRRWLIAGLMSVPMLVGVLASIDLGSPFAIVFGLPWLVLVAPAIFLNSSAT